MLGETLRQKTKLPGDPYRSSFFAKYETTVDDGIRVRRVEREEVMHDLSVKQVTIAELIRAAGLHLPVGPHETVRQQEVALEKVFLDHELTAFESFREPFADHGGDGSDPFEFVLSNPIDIELELLSNVGLNEMTSMALARRLHLATGQLSIQ